MKEDYLWDKSGNDTEIENLEDSLNSFRITNRNAPKLPQKSFSVDEFHQKPKKPFWVSLSFASAAIVCFAFAIISIGAFQFLSITNKDLAISNPTKTTDKLSVKNPITKSVQILQEQSIQQKVKTVKFTRKKKSAKRATKIKKQIRTKVKPNKLITGKIKQTYIKPKVESLKLTKEEKDAYNQLMKVLAVAGSQMKIVREKINGIDENETLQKEGR